MSCQMFEPKYIECDCHTELIQIVLDEDFEIEGKPSLLYFSVYQYGNITGKPSLRNRLRQIWRILTYGSPYSDAFVLKKKGVEKLISILEEYRDKMKYAG